MSINVIFTPENRKYMHIDFAINVIQTAKIENICTYEIVRVLYGKTIDVILTAENQSVQYVNAPPSV